MTINEAYRNIQRHIEDPGPYGHNIVTCILTGIAAEHGTDAANQMVDDLDLVNEFGIGKVE